MLVEQAMDSGYMESNDDNAGWDEAVLSGLFLGDDSLADETEQPFHLEE